MVVLPGTRDPLLVWGGQVHTWTPGGYTARGRWIRIPKWRC
jgi:hypothetical protein